MKFSVDGQVRYSEVDNHGIITIDALVNYLQDCTMLHSETVGHGIKHLKETGEFWFLSAWQIDILRAPVLYEKIKIITNPYEFKGIFGSRNFHIVAENGEELVRANSVWVYLNLNTQVPQRIPKEEGMAYGEPEPKLDMDYAPRKIKLLEPTTECPVMPVYSGQIDTNQHVNNCEYIKTAMEAAGIEKMPSRIRAEYKKAAVMGDNFHPFIYRDDNICIVDLHGDDNVDYATVEFTY